jgi:hypothetical protein
LVALPFLVPIVTIILLLHPLVDRDEGHSDFVHDEEKDLSRFKDGRFAFSRTQVDVRLLEERGCKA